MEVHDKRTGEKDYIIFDIFTTQRSFVAQHSALSEKQEKSKKIAFVRIPIDKTFSLNHHLQELYAECQTAIIDSEWYNLAD